MNLPKQAFHGHRLQFGLRWARELEEVAHEMFEPVNLVTNNLKVFVFGRAGLVAVLQRKEPNLDGGERIANFMSNAGGKHAQ